MSGTKDELDNAHWQGHVWVNALFRLARRWFCVKFGMEVLIGHPVGQKYVMHDY
jgi:hypothetical protein